MLLITTALMIEARPLCERLGLSALSGQPYPVFLGESSVLVITGTGSQRAAGATGWALGRFPEIHAAMNIGFAAASESTAPLHSWHRIHSIRDTFTGRLHVPDILDRHGLPEAALVTVGKPVTEDPRHGALVDMEGCGFYEAARAVLAPDRIMVLKWVSDAFSGKLDPAALETPYKEGIEDALATVVEHQDFPNQGTPEPGLVATARERLRLTRTQDIQLTRWIRGYLARGGSAEAVVHHLPESPPSTKSANSRILKELKDVLKG